MKYLKHFEEKKILAYDERMLDYLPKNLKIYTSTGTFDMKLSVDREKGAKGGQSTREVDVIRAIYSRKTKHTDGEPDSLCLDIHLIKNQNGFKTIVDILYGDSLKFEFSIEAPNKVKVGTYNGFRSVNDPYTQFGFEDESIQDLCDFFNTFDFGYKLTPNDFKAIDKYDNSFKPENPAHLNSLKSGLKNTFHEGDEIFVVIDNTKSPEHNFINNLINYLKYRGVNYEVSSSVDELKKIMDKYDIVGAFSTGSDFNISKGEKSQVAEFAHKNLQCPILGICYGLHAMVDFYGGEIKDSGKLQQDHFKLTTFSEKHPLFKDIEMQDLEFSFDFKDIISKMPSGFKQMCMLDSIICGISDSQRKRFAVLFHPEDVETSYPFLDNFRILCSGEDESKEQEKLMQGQFEHLISFKNFVK